MKLDVRSEKLDKEIGSLSLDNPTSNLQSQDPSSNIQHPTSIVEDSPIKDAGWVKVVDLRVGDQIAVADDLSSGGFSGNQISQSNKNTDQGSSYIKENPTQSSIIHYLTSLNNFNPIINNTRESVNPADSYAKTITNLPKSIDSFASSSTWRSDIKNDSSTKLNAYQWDPIVSIEYTGEEQVWDLAIEGTHNFLANNIVAHNTYINGSLGLGTLFTGATTPTNGLAIQGNVGFGTTSPVGALHVVGQCVAEGTRIRRRRRRKGKLDDGDWKMDDEDGNLKLDNQTSNLKHLNLASNIQHLTSDYIYEDIPVEDIRPDDEVLSLNDKTGQWEWHKVETTMDMGIQTVYRLETENGKWIETTSNHPYLVLVKSNIDQKTDNQNYSESYANFHVQLNEFFIFQHSLSIYTHNSNSITYPNLNATRNAAIPNRTLVKNGHNLNFGTLTLNGTMMAAANQPAERLINKSDNLLTNTGSISDSISQAKWLKVFQLKAGMEIATLNGWEKIVNIQNAGRKQTYDLQIAGTHNFLANNIVAHNTYISGNLGIGFTTPDRSLQVAADLNSGSNLVSTLLGTAGSQFDITGSTANNLQKKLGIGLDTTNNYGFIQAGANLGVGSSAAYNLIINPAGGNIGIGVTSPNYVLDVNGTFNVKTLTPASANGGTITTSGGYTIHTFTSSGTFTPNGSGTVDYLVVAGGGGGGKGGGGGGGGGGLLTATGYAVTAQAYTITVGTGGASSSSTTADNGLNSVFGTITATGGGGGGRGGDGVGAASTVGANGGSGGGGGGYDSATPRAGGTGSSGQGNAGGANSLGSSYYGGGGGGGAGAVGGDGSSTAGGTSGTGLVSSISGSAVTYAAGGVGSGASGGVGSAGSANTGNGGQGGSFSGNLGGAGGSGIVIIRYLTSTASFITTLTAISGNVGVGTTNPLTSLYVTGNAMIGYASGAPASLSNGLAVRGNVGIGTTSPTAGPLVVGTDSTNGNGAYVTIGGTWTNGSSREFKENFTQLNSQDILDKINGLDILQWNYKLEDPSIRHIGPIAEEFYAAFGVGNDNKHISTIDPAGVALIGIKALSEKVASQSALLFSLSLDREGNLDIPKVKIDKLLLSDNVGLGSSIPGTSLVYDFGSTDNIDINNGTSVGGSNVDVLASLKNLDQAIATNSANIASLKDQIASLSSVIASDQRERSNLDLVKIATGSSNPRNDDLARLNLTPPDTLYATSSAALANTSKVSFGSLEVSEATVSAQLKAYNLNVSESLKSLGTTTLAKTAINGDLTIDGTLSIENGSDLNVIPTLFLQKSPLANLINLFDGKVIVDKNGNITTQGIVTASEIITGKLVLSSTKIATDSSSLRNDTIGTGKIPAGQVSVVINTAQVTPSSKVFVTPRTKIGSQALIVESIVDGQSFTVSLDHTLSTDTDFDWWVIQTE